MKKLIIILALLPMFVTGQIQQDKVYHTIAGYTISGLATVVASHYGMSKPKSILIGFGAGFTAGVVKEAYDYGTGNGTASLGDVVWTSIGSGLASITVGFVINNKKSKRHGKGN